MKIRSDHKKIKKTQKLKNNNNKKKKKKTMCVLMVKAKNVHTGTEPET
jgi:hypothetical protein